MGLFGKKPQDSMLDVIRCDEQDYLVWKWSPHGQPGVTARDNAIRWGSSLRVKDGEVAVFVYRQKDGQSQDFIEGPYDETLKTANFPVLGSIIGLAYGGGSPFQAEVYFINLAGNQQMEFGVPWFDVADPRFLDFPLRVAVRGSLVFNITDYKAFIKLHRLISFDHNAFKKLVRDALIKNIKGTVANAPSDAGIPVLQIERRIMQISDLVEPRIKEAFTRDFGVTLVRFDISSIEVDKQTDEYRELRAVTADLETATRQAHNEVNIQNLRDTQAINAENMSETLAVQRRQMEIAQELQSQTQFLAAHQINRQAEVLGRGMDSLGTMAAMGGGGSGGGGFNPAGLMVGMAMGGAAGGQLASMMNTSGQTIQQTMHAPPPLPTTAFHVSVNGEGQGPFGMAQLQDLHRAGQLTSGTHVWKPGMPAWEQAGNVAELAPILAAAVPPPMPQVPPLPPQPPAPPAGV